MEAPGDEEVDPFDVYEFMRQTPLGALAGRLRQDGSVVIAIFVEVCRFPAMQQRFPDKTHWGAVFVHGADYVGASDLHHLQSQLVNLGVNWEAIVHPSHIVPLRATFTRDVRRAIDFAQRQMASLR